MHMEILESIYVIDQWYAKGNLFMHSLVCFFPYFGV